MMEKLKERIMTELEKNDPREQKKIQQLVERFETESNFNFGQELSKLSHDFHQTPQVIAEKLIETKNGHVVAESLGKFQGLNHEKIAEKLIETGFGWAVLKNLKKFQGLNQAIAEKLIEAGYGHATSKNLEKFQGLNHEKIAEKLIETGFGWALMRNLDKFKNVNEEKLAKFVQKILNKQDISLPKIVTEFKPIEEKQWPPDIQNNFKLLNELYHADSWQKIVNILRSADDPLKSSALAHCLYHRFQDEGLDKVAKTAQGDIVQRLIFSQEPALLNPNIKDIYDPQAKIKEQKGFLRNISEIVRIIQKKHPQLIGLIVLGSLSKGYWQKGSDLDWTLIFAQPEDKQTPLAQNRINKIKNDFRKTAESLGTRLCADHYLDFSRLTEKGLPISDINMPLCALFNGFFIGDRKELNKLQANAMSRFDDEQWTKIRWDWIYHLSNYSKTQERFNLTENQTQLIIDSRNLLWGLPPLDEMKKRYNINY